jgi:ferredoxin-NADP reductase
MTSFQLVVWIAGGVLLQVAIYLGIGFLRHWQDYLALRTSVVEGDVVEDGAGIVRTAVHPAAPVAWPGWRDFQVVDKRFEDASQQVCSFYLKPQDGLALPPFLPGQFLTFQLDIASLSGAAPAPVVRCYSLSDSPQSATYRISIKRVPAPGGSGYAPGRSSNYFHDHVGLGSVVRVRAPSGHFHIDLGDAPVVLIAGGIGITPMLSMLNWCVTSQPKREIWLFYGVRDGSELVMWPHLQALAAAHANVHLHVCFSQSRAGDTAMPAGIGTHIHHGRVDVALLRTVLPLKHFHFYLCGPTPMLQSLVPALEDWGVADSHIHYEAFGPASIPRKASQRASLSTSASTEAIVVSFSKSARQVAWTPGSGNLLDFAEAHGIAVNSGCRAGSCGSCQTVIRAGEVVYNQTPDCDPEAGSCLLCVTQPKTNVTLEI